MAEEVERLTYDEAERINYAVISAVYEILVELGVSADDPRIIETFRALQLTINDLYSYVEPRST